MPMSSRNIPGANKHMPQEVVVVLEAALALAAIGEASPLYLRISVILNVAIAEDGQEPTSGRHYISFHRVEFKGSGVKKFMKF
jgi:hypothetical protein